MNVNECGIRFSDLAKKLARYALIEMFVPGGTLIILGLLIAGGSLPVTAGRVFAVFAPQAGRLRWRMNTIAAAKASRDSRSLASLQAASTVN